MPERNLVIVTGTRDLSKRQEIEEPFESAKVPEVVSTLPSAVADVVVEEVDSVAKNKTGDTKPQHNTYLTTPIITALLISFGIFIPIVVMSVSALASVQVPPRMLEIGKALSVDKSRKDQ